MKSRRDSRQRLIKYAALIGGGLLVVVLLVGWLLFQRIPSWYRPAHVAAKDLQTVKDDLVGTFERFSDLMNGEKPFTFRLTQDQLNAWLAAREQIWPPAHRWVPPEVEDPFVVFEPQQVTVAGSVAFGSVQTVANATISVGLEGDQLTIRLVGVRAGSLAIPAGWLEDRLRKAAQRPGTPSRPVPALAELVAGAGVPAEFDWPNPRRKFRLKALRFEPGAAIVEIQPLERR